MRPGQSKTVPIIPVFPESGWSNDATKLPSVTAATVLGHLMRTGKSCDAVSGEVTVVQKPLRRGHDFFFNGYVHDVLVAREGDAYFVKAKCWASQKKTTKYLQKVKLLQQRKEDMYVDVDFATCEGCPAGQDGGLCQNIFALLMAIEKFGPRPGCSILPGEQSVTSLRQSWGIRERDVKPHSVSQVVIEKSKRDEERKKRASGSLLFEARGKNYEHSMRTHRRLRHKVQLLGARFLVSSSLDRKACAYGDTPERGALAYHLRKKPVVGKLPTSTVLRQVSNIDGVDDIGVTVTFPALPLAVPTLCTNTKTEVEWCINLAAAQSLEARTRRQADNAEWHSLHGYTVTASNFGRVFNNQKPSTSFLHDLFNPRKIDHLPAIVHGKNLNRLPLHSISNKNQMLVLQFIFDVVA